MINSKDSKIKILHLEDVPSDAEFVERTLKKGKIEFEILVVDNKTDFEKALREFSPDIILSDHTLTDFDSIRALKMVRESGLEIPVILITGAISEEFAVEAMKEGVYDYILKDRLQRLPNAVRNAIENNLAEKERQKFFDLVIENEKRFRTLIEKSTDMIILSAPDGEILYGSPSIANVFGYSMDEIPNISVSDLIHPDDIKEFTEKRNMILLRPGKSFSHQHRLQHKNGKWIWCEAIVTNMLHESCVHALVSNFRDISDKKRVEKQREFDSINLNALINNSNDLMWSVDRDFKLITSNEPFDEITRLISGMVIEKGGSILSAGFIPEQSKWNKQFYERALAGETFTEIIYSDKPAELWSEISYYPIRKGNEVIGTACHSRDITRQKNTEKELIEAMVSAEWAAGIAEGAKKKAESATRLAVEAVKSKQQFLSNMSHEIRTPMNAIIGFTKVMLRTELAAKQKEYLTAIKMSGDALIVLINDILDLAKVNAGKMTFEQTPFKMALSISSMLHVFEGKIQEKNLELVMEYDNKIPDVLVGDPVRLHQIILNLVSNAIKFTTKGKITAGVHLLNEDEEKVTIEFSVTDTGIGIPENKMEKIFENFEQASSGTARLYGGTGLGLAIVRQLVEGQGGSIHIKSKIDEGSVFSFILNFQKTNAEIESETGKVELDKEIKNIKVLVVEDIAFNQLLIETLLDDFGFEHDTAENGKIAIEKLSQRDSCGATNPYDIILMDLQMPEMNGFETTKYIRETMNSKIPIIALTADVTTVDLEKCRAVGMNDYLSKPVDEKLLYNKIAGLVKKPVLTNGHKENTTGQNKKLKSINLDNLNQRTKSKPIMKLKLISLFLEQTPPLIIKMKQSSEDKDWDSLQMAVHKMIPSFSIMGFDNDFEDMAKKVQEYASKQKKTDEIPDLVFQLQNGCMQACKELEEEFNMIKNTN